MLSRAQLRRNLHDGLKKVQLQSMGEEKVQKAANKIASVLNEMAIPYAVVGGLAVMAHGHLRSTTDVDLDLPTLIELKLASAMTAPDRLKDYADVISLIRANKLPRSFDKKLNPWVRDAFADMWRRASHKSGNDE